MSQRPLCLVVDDSRVIRRMAADILIRPGPSHRRSRTWSGGGGVLPQRRCPDFVLLDWNMPEMDGISCLRALRAMDLKPAPIVVMCTTENGLAKIREALESGADEYIMKPYDRDVLLDKLTQVGLVERA